MASKLELKGRGIDWRAKRLHRAAGHLDAALSELAELVAGCNGEDGALLNEVSRLRRVLREARQHTAEARDEAVMGALALPASIADPILEAWADVREADPVARQGGGR